LPGDKILSNQDYSKKFAPLPGQAQNELKP